MAEPLSLALQIAIVGLPVMLVVIAIFILLAKALLLVFPHRRDKDSGARHEVKPAEKPAVST
ncbi:MAG: hypothetical protein DDT21_01306 [Syntrophomonadaceae bacterium]|nr:hypothetical protein [Bacillota bacterium]